MKAKQILWILVTLLLSLHSSQMYTVFAQDTPACTVTPYNTNVNIRSGPGTDHSVQSVLNLGQSLEVTNRTIGSDGNVWWGLASGGWVSSVAVRASGNCDILTELALTSQTFYVSRNGSNADGLSWSTAWNELNQVNWGVIQPGDTILIDGGATEMTYTTTLNVQKSGLPTHPIRIQLAEEPGRNGRIVIFGGRSTPLPYCGQADYTYNPSQISSHGIRIDTASWINIDGTKWRGIVIYGHRGAGLRLNDPVSNIQVRNMEIFDNGNVFQGSGGWRSDSPGVRLAGTNITLERMLIHDNGQDAIQSGGGVSNFVLRESWLYNYRQHPSVTGESFNYCTHTDGLQIYNGGVLSGFLIERTVIGPGFTNGLILGSWTSNSSLYAEVHNVTLRDVLVTKSADNGVISYPNTPATGWVLERVTLHCSNTKFYCLYLEGGNHTIRDSIVYNAGVQVPTNTQHTNNCQTNTVGDSIGDALNPLFANVIHNDAFSIDDYTQLQGSPCEGKGSQITSPGQLLGSPQEPEVTLLWPQGTLTDTGGNPVYTWSARPGTNYYHLYLHRAGNIGDVVMQETIFADTYCNLWLCRLDATTLPNGAAYWLTNGNYQMWLYAYSNNQWRGPFPFTIQESQPGPVTLLPVTEILTLQPTFSWTLDTNAAHASRFWVYLAPTVRLFDAVVHTWVTRRDACGSDEGTVCSFRLPTNLTSGVEYSLYVRGWSPGGFSTGGLDGWVGPETFTLGPHMVTGLSAVVAENGLPTLSWEASAGVTWYQVWVGTLAPEGTHYLEWNEAAAYGCSSGGTCSLTLINELPDGTYDWFVQGWGPSGYTYGGEYGGWAQGPAFTINP